MATFARSGVFALIFPVAVAAQASPIASRHPLDPLTAPEIEAATRVLRDAGKLGEHVRLGVLALHEPRKADRARTPRRADVLAYDWATGVPSEGVVDLATRRIEEWRDFPAGDPPLRGLTIARSGEIAFKDPRVIAAMRRRGITHPERVTAQPSELDEERPLPLVDGARVGTLGFFGWDTTLSSPVLEGLLVKVNLTTGAIQEVMDRPLRPPADPPESIRDAVPARPLRPLEVRQPAGASFTIDGTQIRWHNWRLHVGAHPRRGVEVWDVAWLDGGRARSVLYRASIAEVAAHYGDPKFVPWYPRDEGDYGLLSYARDRASAVIGADAPTHATFIPAVFADDRGRPVTVPRSIAVYERDGGTMWRHAGRSHRARQLVITGYSTIDNYDYLIHWIFGQDGAIEAQVQLTGNMNTYRTPVTRDTLAAHVDHASYAHLVAPGVYAPNHQHFFSFRLDLDVDGAASNRVVESNTEAMPADAQDASTQWWAMRQRTLATEREAQRDVSMASVRRWSVLNTAIRNWLGQPVGYTLVPGEVGPMFAQPGSPPRRRLGFATHQLWATPYEPNEMYPAGAWGAAGPPDAGLPGWTRLNRPLSDRDVVLWYTLTVTHVPRAEDWPSMPVHTAGFRLVPTNFLGRNPALTQPANGNR